MRRTVVLFSTAVLVAGLSAPAAASGPEGTLDPTFGTGGRTTSDMGGIDVVEDVLPWGDRLLVVGEVWRRTAFVARYTHAGRLDRTFSGDCRIILRFPTFLGGVDAAITPDDHLVVMAPHVAADGRHTVTSLSRYEPNGRLDTSFGEEGRIDLPRVEATAIAVESDGMLLLAGAVRDGSKRDGFAAVRLTAGGRRDHRFSRDGVAIASFPFREEARQVLALPGGRVLVAGYGVIGGCSGGGCTTPYLLARFGSGGRPDTSFGGDGRVNGHTDMGCTCGPNVAIDPFGRIVAGENYIIARVLPSGAPDSSFGEHGVVDLFALQNRFVRTAGVVTTQPDGRILAIVDGDDNVGRVTRFTADGRLDTSFGFRGRAPLPSTEHRPSFRALALDADGRILAAGDTLRRLTPLNVVIARYT